MGDNLRFGESLWTGSKKGEFQACRVVFSAGQLKYLPGETHRDLKKQTCGKSLKNFLPAT